MPRETESAEFLDTRASYCNDLIAAIMSNVVALLFIDGEHLWVEHGVVPMRRTIDAGRVVDFAAPAIQYSKLGKLCPFSRIPSSCGKSQFPHHVPILFCFWTSGE